uniref:Ribonuclease T2 n=1 Tax=Schistosoma japonicum TaxID=6182 RepID=C1LS49_SCHJA|nr:Ribonuclease T2 [Schistosoma japonicum]
MYPLLIGLIVLSLTITLKSQNVQDNSWDRFVFEIIWTPSVCNHSVKCDPPEGFDHFTIVGLWPVTSSGSRPKCTTIVNFNMSEIEDLRGELLTYWPYYRDVKTSENKWRIEYEINGPCAIEGPIILSERDYFSYSIAQLKNMDILKTLWSHGIMPSDTIPQNKTSFQNALELEYKVNVTLMCTRSSDQAKKKSLERIVICLTRDFTFTQCPPGLGGRPVECPPQFMFPAYKQLTQLSTSV